MLVLILYSSLGVFKQYLGFPFACLFQGLLNSGMFKMPSWDTFLLVCNQSFHNVTKCGNASVTTN